MIGNYLGSARSVLNAGEYQAFYLAYGTLPYQLNGQLSGLIPAGWEPHRQAYMQEVQRHAAEFIVRVTREQGCSAFCDSSPRNLLVLANLVETFPDALFVLTIRHYSGVIQSLLRLGTISLLPGNEPSARWFDPTAVAAAAIWSRHYRAAMKLPRDQTVIFGYDNFCAQPEPVLARLKVDLARAGFPTDELDDSLFATSHASAAGRPRPTVAQMGASGARLNTIPSYEAATWSPAIELDVEPVVGVTHHLLQSFYPDAYAEPAGYPGAEALLEAARAALASNSPSDEGVSQGAPKAGSRPAPAASRAQAPQKGPKTAQGSGRSARGRPAKGS
jgi:sulfotransferase family protein